MKYLLFPFGYRVRAGVAALMSILPALSFPTTAFAYTENTLYSFCSVKQCADGAEPMGELAMDQAGNLYGTTYAGGLGHSYRYPGWGTVFQFSPATGQYAVLHQFDIDTGDGAWPKDVRLVIDTAGNLYGTTSNGGNNSGGGVVFELIRKESGWREKIRYTFCSRYKCRDGGAPLGGLTYAGAAAGQLYDGTSPLYGTTGGGGEGNGGTVFSLAPKPGTKKWKETVLYAFCSQAGCADGAEPQGALLLDSSGNMYGTTQMGGTGNGTGTVFELSPNGSGYIESVLYNFCSQLLCVDGTVPLGGVVMDGSGNLFGMTEGGGSEQDGLIFEVSPNGSQWQYNVLASFDGSNGRTPEGALLLDASGNLFGTTYYGGDQKKGTVFEFNGGIQTLYSFCGDQGCPDGKHPAAGVIEDGAGNLFGTTAGGGANHDNGIIFELSVQR